MIELTGVDLDYGRDALRRTGTTFWWRGWTLVMLSGVLEHVPAIRLQPVDGPDVRLPAGARGAGFGLQANQSMRDWAQRIDVPLLLPEESLTDYLADKARLPHLADAAGVAVPASTTLDDAGPGDVGMLTTRHGEGPLVVQRTPNNLTGTGTRLVRDVTELRECLTNWAGQPVKVAEYVEGVDLTVSGCVGDHMTFVSGVSHQLVGFTSLTATWGAHCGNQVLDGDDLPAGAAGQCGRIATAIGEVLRAHGFRGLFGLDLVLATDGSVVLLEINPRIQSVTSLLNHVEAAARLLPFPGVHLLTHLGLPTGPPVTAVTRPRRTSQLIVTAIRPLRVGRVPRGRFTLDQGRLRRLSADVDGAVPAPDEVVVWPVAAPSSVLAPGERLLVAMFGSHVADVGHERKLAGWAESVIEELRAAAADEENRGA